MNAAARLVVVGSGVLGLSCALELARAGHAVVVVSSPRWPRASEAAAANLALKAQSFARHPHYALKLRMRAAYAAWLKGIENDSRRSVPFRQGPGLATFLSHAAREVQAERVRQPEELVRARGLPPQGLWAPEIPASDVWALCYEYEAWVDARALLAALEGACEAHGVRFVQQTIDGWSSLVGLVDSSTSVLLCAGAGTPRLLERLELGAGGAQAALLEARLSKARWTAGSVFVGASRSAKFGAPRGVTQSGETTAVEPSDGPLRALWRAAPLVDLPEGEGLTPTLSGPGLAQEGGAVFVSSTTVRVRVGAPEHAPPCAPENEWAEENARLLKATAQGLAALGLPAGAFGPWTETRHGVRVGFGHEELVACPLKLRTGRTEAPLGLFRRAFLLAGAHKSGFLFAPAALELLEGLGLLSQVGGLTPPGDSSH